MQRQAFMDYLSGKPTGTIPGSFWFHNTEDKWEGTAAKDAHLGMLEQTGVDFLKIMDEMRLPFSTIKTASDWDQYVPPKRHAPHYEKQFDVIRRITDALDGEIFTYTTIFSPLRCVGITRGYEMIEAHMAENPKGVARAFFNMGESLAQYAVDCMTAGADSIYYSAKGAERGRFSKEAFETIVLQNDLSEFHAICEHTPYAMVHICGFDMQLEYYYNWPGAAVNWDAHHNDLKLHQGAALFRHPVLCGGMENRSGVLVNGTDDEIRSVVQSVVDAFLNDSHGKRMILGADCTLPTDVSYHRIRVALEALRAL